MPRGFQGESVAQEARGGSRAAVERGRAAASRSFQTSPMEDSSRFEQANPNRDERGSYNPGDIAREALTYDQFMTATGRTETNPYGDQGFFSRVFGIDPSKINYAASTPGGIATLNQINALAYDQYMNPRDAQGNIRGMLREGSPTRSGTVVYDPTMETDLGIMGAIPYVGGLMRMANRRSALNISPYDNPLFSDMSDMGNELGAFPPPADEIAAAGKAAAEASFTNTPIPTADELIAQAYQDESLLQGPPQLQMDEITAGGVNTIQGMLDFPGTQQDRRFEASSSGTDRRGGEDLLRGYLERFPLYQ